MVQLESALYRGVEKGTGFCGGVRKGSLFLVLEFMEGVNTDDGKKIIEEIEKDDNSSRVSDLKSFDQCISHYVTQYNFPSSFSLSAAFLKGNILYLKTAGKGKIYLKRGGTFARLIEGDTSASGLIKEGDFFILLTEQFIEVLGSDMELRALFNHGNPQEIVDNLSMHLKERTTNNIAAFFIRYNGNENIEEVLQGNVDLRSDTPIQKLMLAFKKVTRHYNLDPRIIGRRRMVTFAAVIAIFIIFLWSVVFGIQRRNESFIGKKITDTKEIVTKKLSQAEEASFLDVSGSIDLLEEAKQDVEKLKKEVGVERKEIAEIEKMIQLQENKIVKKEDKGYEEFFDLTLASKNVTGEKVYLDNDILAILDSKNKVTYLLSLAKKSIDKKTSIEMSGAKSVAIDKDSVFFLTAEGIFQIPQDGKAKKIISKDPDWGNIIDFWIYNGNIYLLDKTADDIYKYVLAEGGYSNKSSYFTGDKSSITNPNSFAIDSSVYIGLDGLVLKFTGGILDDFATSWPERNIHINKVFTSDALDKVYVWDKAGSSLYILNKNGTYERQIRSSILTKATDLTVFKNTVYLLIKEKIYSVGLD